MTAPFTKRGLPVRFFGCAQDDGKKGAQDDGGISAQDDCNISAQDDGKKG